MPWGPLTVKRHRELSEGMGVHLHVWHDGVDVTSRCVFADDTSEGGGHAVLLRLGADGKPYVDRELDEVAKVIVRPVEIIEGAAFAWSGVPPW